MNYKFRDQSKLMPHSDLKHELHGLHGLTSDFKEVDANMKELAVPSL